MEAWLRSWRQQIKKHRVAIGVVAIVLVVAITLIIVGYWFDWTGFSGYNKITVAHTISGTNVGTVIRTEEYQPGKGLWDWLNLLGVFAIPALVALGAARQNGYAERLMRTIKEEDVDLAEYEDCADAMKHIGRFLDEMYVHKRIHSSLGYLTPAEFETQWRQEQSGQPDMN